MRAECFFFSSEFIFVQTLGESAAEIEDYGGILCAINLTCFSNTLISQPDSKADRGSVKRINTFFTARTLKRTSRKTLKAHVVGRRQIFEVMRALREMSRSEL
jgi:hypothetical protein